MPIVSTDIKVRLSGGAGNSNPAASLGGAKSSTEMASVLFDDVSSAEAAAGRTEYRCVYVHNNHGTLSLETAVIWITAESPDYMDIGVGTAAINGTEQTVANETTAPTGVTFSSPTTKGAGLALGTIPAGQHKAVWVRRTVPSSAAAASGSLTFRVEGDTQP